MYIANIHVDAFTHRATIHTCRLAQPLCVCLLIRSRTSNLRRRRHTTYLSPS